MTDKTAGKNIKRFLIPIVFVFTVCFLENVPSFADETIGDQARKAEQSVKKSVDEASKKTGAYLTSDDFHQKLKHITDAISKAIENGGNWIGKEIDQASTGGKK